VIVMVFSHSTWIGVLLMLIVMLASAVLGNLQNLLVYSCLAGDEIEEIEILFDNIGILEESNAKREWLLITFDCKNVERKNFEFRIRNFESILNN
jgi:hypothetical protein